ncbi:MAG TPA: hypothetical protein VLS25_02750 [Dehalococcoidia bacterium]|nr:hypothetical protein [Dehalococcoidia bacterium]
MPAAVALLPLLLHACGGGDDGTGSSAIPQPSAPSATALPDRPPGRFTMCVQAIRGAQQYQDEAMKRLGDALAEVQKDGRWPRLFPSQDAPVVNGSCPEPPAIPAVNFVEKPNYYQVFAFVVVQAPFDARFAQESVKNDAVANVEETAGIFVTTADLCDQARLVQMLKTAAKFDHTLNPTKTPGPGVTTAPPPTPCLGG